MRCKYDLLVIKISHTKRLKESRPCYHCLRKLERSGIKIQNVYYSTRDSIIMKEKFSEMRESENTVYSSGYLQSMKRHHKNIDQFVYKNN